MPVLAYLLVAAVVIWSLLEAVQADKREIRGLPKMLWVIVIILLAPFGSLAWFLFGRPKVAVNAAPGPSGGHGPRLGRPASRETAPRPAPDDDPEFLRRLSQQAEQQKMLRLLEEGPTADEGKKPGPPRTDDDGGDTPSKA